MFLNITNHPSSNWSKFQINEAEKYGKIKDYSFPNIPATMTKEEITSLAEQVLSEVCTLNPNIILCQGESTFQFALVTKLKEKGFIVVSACSERKVEETISENGETIKTVVFQFIQFREY